MRAVDRPSVLVNAKLGLICECAAEILRGRPDAFAQYLADDDRAKAREIVSVLRDWAHAKEQVQALLRELQDV